MLILVFVILPLVNMMKHWLILKRPSQFVSMITESFNAKLYYYRGLIWLGIAEKSEDFAEEDPLKLSYEDFTKVLTMDNSWEP